MDQHRRRDRCAGFTARTQGPISPEQIDEFARGVEELRASLKGGAHLAAIEQQFEFTLTGDGPGHASVEGEARNASWGTARLAFKFAVDQTYLPKIVEALQRFCAR